VVPPEEALIKSKMNYNTALLFVAILMSGLTLTPVRSFVSSFLQTKHTILFSTQFSTSKIASKTVFNVVFSVENRLDLVFSVENSVENCFEMVFSSENTLKIVSNGLFSSGSQNGSSVRHTHK
jgi:hypothetical protein